MKLIAYGGTETKYTKGSTRDALILATNTEFIDGTRLDVYITKDNYLVATTENGFQRSGLTKETLENTNYETIIRHNIGTTVKFQGIIPVSEAMKIFNNKNKILLLNIIEHDNKNSVLVDNIKDLTKVFPNVNLYLESDNDEVIEYLLSSNINAKNGKIIKNRTINNYNLDFYSFDKDNIDVNLINNLYRNGKQIIITNINTGNELINIYNQFPNIFENIYIETSNPTVISATYILQIQKNNV